MSPTRRTLKWLRDTGWMAQVVEKWVAQAGRRIDLFGVIDIVAVKPGVVLGVQCTSSAHVPDHVRKAKAEPRLKNWLESGSHFVVVGWGKRGARGKAKKWTLTHQEHITFKSLT